MPQSATLCLLPGLVCDANVWGDQTAALGSDRAVYAPDFFGFESIEAMARKVLEETSGLLAVAGHSMGGRVALDVLKLAPERVERLALLDTGVHGVRETEAKQRMHLVEQAYKRGMEVVVERWLPPMLHPDHLLRPGITEPLAAMICRATPQVFEGQQRALLGRRDATDDLDRVRIPVAVICGREDGWAPVSQHAAIARAVEGSVLTVIGRCGHMSTVEQPDQVTWALRAWLDR